MDAYLSEFHDILPPYEVLQRQASRWLKRAYKKKSALVESHLQSLSRGLDQIEKRRVFVPDIIEENLDRFTYLSSSFSAPAEKRVARFETLTDQFFKQWYPEKASFPSHLLHVSCTGYTHPSPGIRRSSQLQENCPVTHIYHMGCYASLPAIRVGHGLLHSEESVDVCHTELASLQFHRFPPTKEQMVINSLFADGAIKYRLTRYFRGPSLQLRGIAERLVPATLEKMTWKSHRCGFQMRISPSVPRYILQEIDPLLSSLSEKGGWNLGLSKKTWFAIHPGGPKIIEWIAKHLRLEPWQYAHAKQVLRSRGNTSSATLPLIWKEMLEDPRVKNDDWVISMAFGPGLTLIAGIFQVRR